MREVLDTFKSHRDVDRYLMSQLVGEVSKNITRKLVSLRPRGVGSHVADPKSGFN
jgi:hypothetical protein